MKRFFASAAIVAIAALGVPLATTASASASAPSIGALDTAWTHICAKVTPPENNTEISHTVSGDLYECFAAPFFSPSPPTVPTTAGLQGLCGAMGGRYSTFLDHENNFGAWSYGQFCTIGSPF